MGTPIQNMQTMNSDTSVKKQSYSY